MISRKSHKRDSILSLLQSVKCHPTAEWIYMELKEEIPELSLATVYRNLEQLAEMGIIQKSKATTKQPILTETRIPTFIFLVKAVKEFLTFPRILSQSRLTAL